MGRPVFSAMFAPTFRRGAARLYPMCGFATSQSIASGFSVVWVAGSLQGRGGLQTSHNVGGNEGNVKGMTSTPAFGP